MISLFCNTERPVVYTYKEHYLKDTAKEAANMSYTLQAACFSHIGKRRANHEDNFYFNGICLEEQNRGTHDPLMLEEAIRQDRFFDVFDGMGGENYGEQAAFAAAVRLQEYIAEPRRFYQSGGRYLKNLTHELNLAVVSKARELLTSRMGTTMAALYLTPCSAYACNVGDSRVYRLRDQVFAQMSRDHVSTLPVPPGRKPPLVQHLGMDPEEVQVAPHIVKDGLKNGDIYLICTDGLTDMVDNAVIADILQRDISIPEQADALLQAALENGGRDNITAILCRVFDTGKA